MSTVGDGLGRLFDLSCIDDAMAYISPFVSCSVFFFFFRQNKTAGALKFELPFFVRKHRSGVFEHTNIFNAHPNLLEFMFDKSGK